MPRIQTRPRAHEPLPRLDELLAGDEEVERVREQARAEAFERRLHDLV